ncbi:MAG TPA: hypothetical protein VF173_34460 [Thermoanaerobaculia bacterium]|nr:hypothetical protein [Thermoanaerobaculia bacterium]
MAARGNRVVLDLNSEEFQKTFLALETAELKQVAATLSRLRGMDWNTVYSHSGLNWEAVVLFKAPNGSKAYSLRLSQKIRALAYRDGDLLRFMSLHTDHDSAYKR